MSLLSMDSGELMSEGKNLHVILPGSEEVPNQNRLDLGYLKRAANNPTTPGTIWTDKTGFIVVNKQGGGATV